MEGHKRNEDIREELAVKGIETVIKTYQKKWTERLERTPEHCCININRRTEDARDVRQKDGRNSFDPCN
jgi:hypothetical protein